MQAIVVGGECDIPNAQDLGGGSFPSAAPGPDAPPPSVAPGPAAPGAVPSGDGGSDEGVGPGGDTGAAAELEEGGEAVEAVEAGYGHGAARGGWLWVGSAAVALAVWAAAV